MTPRTIAEDGFSLPELLVSMLFVVWFGAMLHQFSRAMLHSVRLQEERGWAQETVRVAVEVMTHELRLGGYSADGRPIAVLRTATADEVAIQSDLNGDGDTNDANEVISYRYDAGRQALMRATGAAPGQPMVDHVPAGRFGLRYRDAGGVELAGDLDATTRARVCQVAIRLGVEYPNPDPALQQPLVVSLSASVQLRNQPR